MADDQQQRKAEGSEVCNFFRKPSRNRANIRKRKADAASSSADAAGDAEEEEEEEEAPSGLQHSNRSKKTLTAVTNKLHFSTSKPSSSKASEADPDADEETRLFHFESSNEIQVQHDSRATAALETETEFSRDHRAIRERTLKQAEERLKSNPNPNSSAAAAAADKIYKGMHSYTDYTAGFRREQTVAAEKAGGAHGPLRASAHIRTSARFDYQPDICKDYKETGYCGYGDSCKFMHDRGDYKSGWQMEREWDEAEKARKRNLAMGGGDGDDDDGGGGDEDDDDDALPFACFICRQPFEDAVVTKCKHYFCEHCALKCFWSSSQRCGESGFVPLFLPPRDVGDWFTWKL